MEIAIGTDSIRLGQLLKYAGLVADGGEAKALIAAGAVHVDGEPETRRGRQVPVGSVLEVTAGDTRHTLRVVAEQPDDPLTSPEV
ncbi:RNA-binding S4 domain-containing protein [Micropruina sonneratiae]|uniref:RNA-binding S4 domain-containing protein n=1 Tax=Micropruina sonneratiae TaxID=2986940 RepID=UPI002226234F|nr:RNA-binding S4 domain-containing protein [Micropruina sp. KQZ13P-5]MCW3157475.1 RNA-binding S4 domain-containing protein [Micropruina sp. KQZ13P-5]